MKRARLLRHCSFAMLAAVLSSTVPGPAPGQDTAAVRDAVRGATVQIEVEFRDPSNPRNVCTEKGFGSGAVITAQGHVLSAAHLFEPPTHDASGNRIDCSRFTDIAATARIGFRRASDSRALLLIEKEPDRDLALLWFGELPDPMLHLDICRAVSISNGTELLAAGFPYDSDFNALGINFQNLDGQRWIVSGDLTFGHSGGPVVNHDGLLVGVIKGGLSNTDAIRFVVPVALAAGLLNHTSISSIATCGTQTSENPPADRASSWVVTNWITLNGKTRASRVKTLSREFGDSSTCTEDWRAEKISLCIPNGVITRVEDPQILSAGHTGRTWYESQDSRPNCIDVFFGYSDEGRDIQGNCKSQGGIKASWTVHGYELTPNEPSIYEEVRSVGATQRSVIIPPPREAGQNFDEKSWSFRARIERKSGNSTQETYLLSDTTPDQGGFHAEQLGDGTVVIELPE